MLTASGDNSSPAQRQLKHLRQLPAFDDAFATVLSNGSALTWGSVESGSNSSAVRHQLSTVQPIQA